MSQTRCWVSCYLSSTKAPACASVGPYSCFVSKVDETEQYELDPVHIFTDNLARCHSSTECSPSSTCVIPRRDQQLVRISVLRNHGFASIESTVVWKGPKEEIWEQGRRMPSSCHEYVKLISLSLVQVGDLRARFSFVTYKLPKFAIAFFECVGLLRFLTL